MTRYIINLIYVIAFAFYFNVYSQPSNYYMNPSFGLDGTFNGNTPVNGIVRRQFQSTNTTNTFYIEWDSQFNEWYNTSINLNEEFILTFEGASGLNNTSIITSGISNSKFYTMQINGFAYSDRQAIIMETDDIPITFAATPVTPSSPTIFPGQDLALTINLNGSKSIQEKVFVRYTDNGFASSEVVEVSFPNNTSSSGTVVIPGSFNTAGKNVLFYAYSTTVSAINTSNHDLITLHFANNGGTNYTYSVENSWTTSGNSSDFNDPSAWDAGQVPSANQAITIEDNLILNNNYVASSLSINSGQLFSVNNGQTLTITGAITGSGNLIVNGTLQINAGGFTNIAPTYGIGATLIYNSGTTYGRGTEWSSTSGNGYPNNVIITNGTTLDLGANGHTDIIKQISGNLTVDSGSTLSLNINPMTQALDIKGNLINNGTITLSSVIGGDLILEGNFDDNGTFTANGRAVFFEGGNMQNIESTTDPLAIDVMRINKSGGEVIMNQNLLVAETGDPLQFSTSNSILNLNGYTLTLGKTNIPSVLTMTSGSAIKGSLSSGLVILGNGDLGELRFDSNHAVLNNLVINRGSGSTVNIGSTLETITTTINSGELIINSDTSLTVTGTLSTDSNGRLTLESASNSYSSVIPSSVSNAGSIAYKRFVNSNTGGNDLIASPLSGQSWEDFLNSDSNITSLLNDGGSIPGRRYSFGPFSKSTGAYVTWADNQGTSLEAGVGYRAATQSGTTLTFTGTVLTGQVSSTISFNGPALQDWNLIGNPYPSYIDTSAFLSYVVDAGTDPVTRNIDYLAEGSGIYGYDGDASNGWRVITQANVNDPGNALIAPGQGFLVPAADDLAGNTADILFDPSMRRAGSAGNFDDFIAGRSADNPSSFFKLSATTATKSYETQFYFNTQSSLGLDHGYDGKILGAVPSFALYSHLIQDNTGLAMALQSLNTADLGPTTIIPLGVHANAGEYINFHITESNLPEGTQVFLEDTVTNSFTLLNSGDYSITTSTALNGTGRFYLRFGSNALSTVDLDLNTLSVYVNRSDETIVVSGSVLSKTRAVLFDFQGRMVLSKSLDSESRFQTIGINGLHSGVYVLTLEGQRGRRTEKIILD